MCTAGVLLAAVLAAPATGNAGTLASASPTRPAAPVTGAPLAASWGDEFDRPAGTAPDTSKWRYDLGGGGWGNHELQTYTNSTANAAHDGQGHLVITARKEANGGYTSARLLTAGTFSQTYGSFEASIRIPRGQGIWPAFWMLGQGAQWPDNGEIDIMENIGREPSTVYGTMHGPGYSGAGGKGGSRTLPNGEKLADTFHRYGVDWSPNLIVWKLDGQEYFRTTPAAIPGKTWVFDHPFYLLLNVAVGGDWPGYPDGSSTYPQQMVIDYVRVQTSGSTGSRLIGYGGKCLDIPGGSPSDGELLQLWGCHDGANQKWSFEADGTVRSMGVCMDAAGAGTANGTPIQITGCNGNAAQGFTLNGAGQLVNPVSGRCVDVKDWNSAAGALLQLWDCNPNGQDNQRWRRG
ncbi:ricin-type beta-trefoil lectin domain protein [Longispora fulva]|uniref:Beta-glucanase (GH16 family) n=1 Tax=Longispora fulva TaxID=619741 RepID=A0A8J7GNL6_9ACTN|nr:family 16 glycosylhydrolase [Longispora fulva]MBG6140303.1 beta-glucanase (GH16 family) [Longispora fulva]